MRSELLIHRLGQDGGWLGSRGSGNPAGLRYSRLVLDPFKTVITMKALAALRRNSRSSSLFPSGSSEEGVSSSLADCQGWICARTGRFAIGVRSFFNAGTCACAVVPTTLAGVPLPAMPLLIVHRDNPVTNKPTVGQPIRY